MNFSSSFMTIQLGGEIDLTVSGVQNIVLPEKDLHIVGVTCQSTDISGYVSAATFSIGTNDPDYDNIFSSMTSTIDHTNGCFQKVFDGLSCDLIPLGSVIKVNILTPSVATANVQKINLIAYPVII